MSAHSRKKDLLALLREVYSRRRTPEGVVEELWGLIVTGEARVREGLREKFLEALEEEPEVQGPRVSGLRENLQRVIGRKRCTAVEAHGLLRARGWLPNSDDPLAYIRFTLSKEQGIFLRVEGQRGTYELAPDNPYFVEDNQTPTTSV
jgi:hypothetical protein